MAKTLKRIGRKMPERWRIIFTGVRINQNEGKSQKTEEACALHFKSYMHDASLVIPSLQWMYGSMGNGNYPLGIELWLILDITKMINLLTKAKVN